MLNREKGVYAPVFYPAIIIAVVFCLVGIFFPEFISKHIASVQSEILSKFGLTYILAMSVFVSVSLFLMISKFGDIKLGQEHDVPEYTSISWVSMLFAAGMGIGLMFYGVGEPLAHFISPPHASADQFELTKEAMNITFFHWGFEAWSVYATLGLSLAYFSYRHDLPLLPRSVLYPILGKHIFGPIGHAVDIFAILGTLFGVASSLGLGAMQVSAGMHFLNGLPDNVNMNVAYIIFIVSLATISVALGLDKGIKILSNVNIVLAIILLLFVLFLGNTSDLVKDYVQNIGYYLSTVVDKTFNLYAYDTGNQEWLKNWTLFYWGWWIAWSPFVGMFIARVSKGRTIREFIIGVLFVPVGFTFLWMTVFGNSAIDIVMHNMNSSLADAAQHNIPVALFEFLAHFPLSTFTSILAVMLIVTFFVTSADSGALVMDMLATGGAKKSLVHHRIAWSVISGLIAITLLLSGGLGALQAAVIISAFPLLFILLLMCISLIKSLQTDSMRMRSIETHSTVVQYVKANTSWQKRLEAIVHEPHKKQAKEFLQDTVLIAINEVSKEMTENGLSNTVNVESNLISLTVCQGSDDEFIYTAMLRVYQSKGEEKYNRVEVILNLGGQYYDIMGYTKDQIIADIINQFDKHLHYLHMMTADKEILI